MRLSCGNWGRRLTTGIVSLLMWTGAQTSLPAAEDLDLEDFKIPMWNFSTELRGSLGYKDNLLLSHTNAESSAFWLSGVEVMAFRLPTHGWQFYFFGDLSDLRYFDSPSVGSEEVAIAAAQISKDFKQGWKSVLGLNYLYQNQVFDFSDVYTNQSSVGKVLGHTFTTRLAGRKTTGAFWTEGEMSGTRQLLDDPLDNYWQFGPRASAGFTWGHGSELAVAGQYARIEYDTREQVDSLGMAVPDTSLALDSYAADVSLTQVWDEARHWQTITTTGYEISLDNGSGFFNYDVFRASQSIRYRNGPWEIAVRGRIGQFWYEDQTVSATDSSLRRKTMINASLRVERKLAKHLKAQAGYEWDRSISNLDFDDYQASTVSAGLGLVF